MIQVIVGEKGTGKTAYMVAEANKCSTDKDNNIVCIERGERFDNHFPYTVRLVNIEEFPVEGYGQLLAFICGIIAKDYDTSHIFIDSIYKIASCDDKEAFGQFVEALDKLTSQWDVHVLISVSDKEDNLPAAAKPFVCPIV